MPVSDPMLDPGYARPDLGAARRAHADAGDARGAVDELLRASPSRRRASRDGCRRPRLRPVLAIAGGCARGRSRRRRRVAGCRGRDLDGTSSSARSAAAGGAAAAGRRDGRRAASPARGAGGRPALRGPDAADDRDASRARSPACRPACDDARLQHQTARLTVALPTSRRRLGRHRPGHQRDRHLRRPHRHRPVRDAGGQRRPRRDRREGADRAHAGRDEPVLRPRPPGRRAGRHQRPAGAGRLARAARRQRPPADRAVRRPAGRDRPDEAPEGDAGRAPRPRPPAPRRPERERRADPAGRRRSPTSRSC